MPFKDVVCQHAVLDELVGDIFQCIGWIEGASCQVVVYEVLCIEIGGRCQASCSKGDGDCYRSDLWGETEGSVRGTHEP